MNYHQKLIYQIRRDILRMVNAVNSGHPGGSLGCVEFFVALFFSVMDRNNEFRMDGINEDIFFFQMDIFLQYTTQLYQGPDTSL